MRTLLAGVLQRGQQRSQPGNPARPTWRELAAALALVVLIGELLLWPVVVPVSAALLIVGRVSRWRPEWLVMPLLVGVGWLAAAGPGRAADPFRLLHNPGSVLAATAGVQWLPRELPAALVAAAVQVGVLACLSGTRSAASWRPGLVAAARRWRSAGLLAAGETVTRTGCAIGIDARTGRLAELRWADAERGVLLSGTDPADITPVGLAVVCAALRCRKTLLAVELSADGGCAAAALHACTDRLEVALTQVSRPGELAAAAGRAIRARSAVLASGPAESLINEVSGVLARLRERGLLGDCLLWASGCEAVRPGQLGALLDLGPATGTALLLSTTSSACARALAAQVDVGVVCGPVSPDESACVVSPPDADASKALRRQRRGEFTLIGGDQVRTRCLAVPITAGGR